MSQGLETVFSDNINLYEELDITIKGEPEQIPSSLIKKQYRKLALVYHPDKRPDDPNAVHKFHMLSLATHILTDESLRVTYDRWLRRTTLNRYKVDEQRSALINKLSKSESQALKGDSKNQTGSISKIQEYGAMLRKMKHLKIPYGDWVTLSPANLSPERSAGHHAFYDSSTLRLELSNTLSDTDLSDKTVLRPLLLDVLQVNYIYDVYYSSRNDYEHEKSIVVYVVFETPEESKQVYQVWRDRLEESREGLILDISPRVPISYYQNFNDKIDLNPEISCLLDESTIVID